MSNIHGEKYLGDATSKPTSEGGRMSRKPTDALGGLDKLQHFTENAASVPTPRTLPTTVFTAWQIEDGKAGLSSNRANQQNARALDAERELAGLRADAERYRWLRKQANVWTVKKFVTNYWRTLMTDELDAAIDAAMKGNPMTTDNERLAEEIEHDVAVVRELLVWLREQEAQVPQEAKQRNARARVSESIERLIIAALRSVPAQGMVKLYEMCSQHKAVTSYTIKVSPGYVPTTKVCPICEQSAASQEKPE